METHFFFPISILIFHRYATALGHLINTEKLLGSRTLKELEEALFCQTKTSNSMSWDSYWERNDPLRDIDEVAIPVLCICSQDDPIRGEPYSTIPFELFETNPHFFLLMSRYGGHCGFIKEDVSSTMWSHSALLDFFKSTVDFFAMEERLKGLSRRKGTISVSINRTNLDRASRRKEQSCPHNIHDIYNWQRSYTRWQKLYCLIFFFFFSSDWQFSMGWRINCPLGIFHFLYYSP